MKTITFCLVVLCASFPAAAQIAVGDVAPKLVLKDVLQGKLDVEPGGKVRVLEFWATYCGPCIPQIAHLNKLAAEFSGRNIEFVWITHETADTVTQFLKTHPIRGIVALDDGLATFTAYAAPTPCAVLIDASNRVVRKVDPNVITSDVLNDLLFDRPVQLSAIRQDMFPPEIGDPIVSPGHGSTPVNVTVKHASERGWITSMQAPGSALDYEVKATGETLPNLLAFAYALPPSRLLISKYFLGGYYDVLAWVPPQQAAHLQPLLQSALQAAIGYHASLEERELDVLLLDGLPGKLAPSEAQRPSARRQNGVWTADGATLKDFLDQLEAIAQKPVIVANLPSLNGRFKWQVEWNGDDEASFRAAVEATLELSLRVARRTLRVLVVAPQHESSIH